MTEGATTGSAVDRAAALAALGRGPALAPAESERVRAAATADPDARVRAAAIAAIVRVGDASAASAAWGVAITDPDARVRRRAAEMGPPFAARGVAGARSDLAEQVARALVARLADDDVTVVEAAAWGLGELGPRAITAGAVPALADVTTTHAHAIAREAAVAALGAIGEPAGLPAILAATQDKPAVRRRAVLALAPFEGGAVDAALRRALEDRDWQVRQAAEDLTSSTDPDRDVDDGPSAGG
ncbi:MAG TPA: HEAT repeat domain-containing protein [Acidimicrobiia bacterium]|nr:HEAT repeat domain-containing protein [Acidimicrobiia bacterium]